MNIQAEIQNMENDARELAHEKMEEFQYTSNHAEMMIALYMLAALIGMMLHPILGLGFALLAGSAIYRCLKAARQRFKIKKAYKDFVSESRSAKTVRDKGVVNEEGWLDVGNGVRAKQVDPNELFDLLNGGSPFPERPTCGHQKTLDDVKTRLGNWNAVFGHSWKLTRRT